MLRTTLEPARLERPILDEPSSDDRSPRPTARLSGREREMLAMLSRGLSNKEMAARAGISPETVKTHIANIFQKLRVGRRAHAASVGLDLGLIDLADPDRSGAGPLS